MKIPSALLVHDTTIYPRTDVNAINISSLSEAILLGNELPPIVIEAKTNRIVDGVHRWRAHIKAFGEACEVECDVREYASDADLFLDAVGLNSTHGLKIMPTDQIRIFYLGESLGLSKEKMAQAMRMRFDKAERMITLRTAFRELPDGKKEPVVLKGAMKSFSGATLTDQQIATNKSIGGMQPLYYVNQLVALIKSGICNRANENLLQGLYELQALLDKKLRGKQKKAS